MVGVARVSLELANRTGANLFCYGIRLPQRMPSVLQKALDHFFLNYYYFLRVQHIEADIFHAYDILDAYPLILAKKRPTVTSCHDCWYFISSRKSKRLYESVKRSYLHFVCYVSLTRSDYIVCPSHSTKKDIISLFQVPEERIEVIPWGVSARFRQIDSKEIIKDELGIDSPFILHVAGHFAEEEGVDLTIKALFILKQKIRNIQLYIIGNRQGNLYREIKLFVKKCGLDENVLFLGRVSDKELVMYYNAADVLVHPSRYEGFGLPPLEAMACGTPVVATSVASLPEIIGDAGILLPSPPDAEKLARSVFVILTDRQLRQKLINRGLKRSKKFTWERTQRKMMNLYERVINEKKD